LDPRSEIRDPRSGIWDGKKFRSGIRDKHPESATLTVTCLSTPTLPTNEKTDTLKLVHFQGKLKRWMFFILYKLLDVKRKIPIIRPVLQILDEKIITTFQVL